MTSSLTLVLVTQSMSITPSLKVTRNAFKYFQGVLIGRQNGRGVNATITIRRIVANEGVSSESSPYILQANRQNRSRS